MAEENQHGDPSQEESSESTPILPKDSGSYGQVSSGSNTAPKMTWPELVGLEVEEVERKIKEEMPRAQVQVVPPNCFVTMDFNLNRVRLYVDSSGKVATTPRVG